MARKKPLGLTNISPLGTSTNPASVTPPVPCTATETTSSPTAPPKLMLYQIDDSPTQTIPIVLGESQIGATKGTFLGIFELTADDLPAVGDIYVLTVYAWDDQNNPSQIQSVLQRTS